MRQILYTIIIICFYQSTTLAQDKIEIFDRSDRSNYFAFNGYLGQQKTLDEGVSPLIYKGLIFGGGLGYKSEKKSRIWDINGGFLYGNQFSPAVLDMGYFTSYNIDINASYLINIDRSSKLPFKSYFGLQLMHSMHLRTNYSMFNAAFGYDIISGMGISGELQKSFNIKGFELNLWRWKYTYHPHKITFDTKIDFPILFFYLRPTYVVIENFVDGRTEPYDLSRTQSATLGDVVHVTANTGINYHLRNKNIIRFGYVWQYYKIEPEYSPVRGAQHLFQLTFKFKMNKTATDETL